jgi:hypothetical protein
MNDSTPQKRCCKCHQFLPATPDYFNRNRSYLDGLHAECRTCRSTSRYKSQRVFRVENSDLQLSCSVCGRSYPATTEYFRKHRNNLKAQCRECDKAAASAYRAAHPNQSRINSALYNRKHREERNEKARQRQYLKPLSMRIGAQRRRARKRQLPDTLTAAEWRHALDYFQHCCAICGRPQGLWHVIAKEHWVPLSDPRPDNPGTSAINILPMCHAVKDGQGGCNNSKHNQDPVKWLKAHHNPKQAALILARVTAYFSSLSIEPSQHVIEDISGG